MKLELKKQRIKKVVKKSKGIKNTILNDEIEKKNQR
jgi:hypothetical protein